MQTTNVGSNPGRLEQNDKITYTFSEPIDPESILHLWNGSSTNVTVRVYDNGILGLPLGNDALQVYNAANNAVLPLGTVDLGGNDYASGLLAGSYRFTGSTMVMSGNTITITLGTYSSTFLVDAARGTESTAGTMVWTPSTGPEDWAGNALNTTPVSETGGSDTEF